MIKRFGLCDFGGEFSGAKGTVNILEEYSGKQNVVQTVSSIDQNYVWENNCGCLYFQDYCPQLLGDCYLEFNVFAETGTKIGGYLFRQNYDYILFEYKDDAGLVAIISTNTVAEQRDNLLMAVDEEYNKTDFVFGSWNKILFPVSEYGWEVTQLWLCPSFANNCAEDGQKTAYYSDINIMSTDIYNAKKNGELSKYSVKITDANEQETEIELSYGEKITVPSDFQAGEKGWMIDGNPVDLTKYKVTADCSIFPLGEANDYTVKYYLRSGTGAYIEQTADTKTYKENFGKTVSAQINSYAGYTYNEELSIISGKVKADDSLVLAIYYENDKYVFENQLLTDGFTNLTMTKQDMTGVSSDDYRGNTYYYKKTTTDGNTMNTFTYDSTKVGNYLVLSVYYTVSNRSSGFVVWNNAEAIANVENQVAKFYDANGDEIPTDDFNPTDGSANVSENIIGKWISIAINLDDVNFSTEKNTFQISYCGWSQNELYIGEYIYLTPTEFEEIYG